jgi:hypothetical protein
MYIEGDYVDDLTKFTWILYGVKLSKLSYNCVACNAILENDYLQDGSSHPIWWKAVQ